MWCMMNSPLLAGNDLRTMSSETIEILTNKEIISLNQDKGFRQAQRYSREGNIEIWVKPLGKKGKTKAVALMNRGGKQETIQLTPDKIGMSEKSSLRDLWRHENIGKLGKNRSFTIPKHGIVVLKVK